MTKAAEVFTAPPTAASPRGALGEALLRRIYFAGLGLVSLIAFLSLWVQIHGLVGASGLLPLAKYLSQAEAVLGHQARWLLPTLFWFNASDAALHVSCAAGAVVSVLLIAGLCPRLCVVLLWIDSLSLSIAGQTFLSFQWDSLLLEMLLCSYLYAPRGGRPDWFATEPARRGAQWLLWALAFKLMFLSGVTKLLSGDPSWVRGSALQFHYATQPIPNGVSWFAHHAPLWFHQVSLGFLFLVEVPLPLLVCAGRPGRHLFGIGSILLMLLIQATGNYGFFNLQTIVLCLPLLSPVRVEAWVHRFVPGVPASLPWAVSVRPRWRQGAHGAAITAILLFSSLAAIREMVRTARPVGFTGIVGWGATVADRGILSWGEPLLRGIAPWRTINGYGLFRVLTTRRFEIAVETSDDGVQWQACAFPYQPGPVDRAPPFVAPHMPRLDWQMWFAALSPRGNEAWLAALVSGLLEGSPQVCRLVNHPEFIERPPRQVRLVYYEYKFASPEHRAGSGAWWSRTQVGIVMPPRSR